MISPDVVWYKATKYSDFSRGRRAYGLVKRLWRTWPLPSLPKVSQFNEARIPFLKEGKCQITEVTSLQALCELCPANSKEVG
jgi:hypothetical protein